MFGSDKRLFLMMIVFAAAGLLTGSILKYSPVNPVFNSSELTVLLDAGHGEYVKCFK